MPFHIDVFLKKKKLVNTDADEVSILVYNELLELGVVTRPAGRSIVMAPPLIVQGSEIDEIVLRVGKALDLVQSTR